MERESGYLGRVKSTGRNEGDRGRNRVGHCEGRAISSPSAVIRKTVGKGLRTMRRINARSGSGLSDEDTGAVTRVFRGREMDKEVDGFPAPGSGSRAPAYKAQHEVCMSNSNTAFM